MFLDSLVKVQIDGAIPGLSESRRAGGAAQVQPGCLPVSAQTFPFVINGRFCVQSQARTIDGSPGPAGMGFYTCAVLLPFPWTLFISVMSKQSVPELTTPQSSKARSLQYQTKGGPRGPAQAKECSFRVLLHKFNQHDKKEIIWAFVMIWKGEVCVPLIAVWRSASPEPDRQLNHIVKACNTARVLYSSQWVHIQRAKVYKESRLSCLTLSHCL